MTLTEARLLFARVAEMLGDPPSQVKVFPEQIEALYGRFIRSPVGLDLIRQDMTGSLTHDLVTARDLLLNPTKGPNAMAKAATPIPNETLSITIPGDLAAKLTAEADRRVVSRAFLVERFIRQGLPTLPPLPDDLPASGEPE